MLDGKFSGSALGMFPRVLLGEIGVLGVRQARVPQGVFVRVLVLWGAGGEKPREHFLGHPQFS